MSLRPRDRIALGVVLLAALLGAYYVLALKPEQHKAAALATSIAGQRQTIASEQQAYATGRAAKSSLNADEAQWAALRLAVPAQSDIPGLLRTLEKTADSVHVNMQAIALTGSSSSATPTTVSSTPSSGAGMATGVPVQLTFAGGCTALDKLVKRLNGLVVVSGTKVRATGPLLSISNVSLSGAPDLTVQLTATIYQLGTASTAAGATDGGQP
jgi:Tfp pilus assembly protein PilO